MTRDQTRTRPPTRRRSTLRTVLIATAAVGVAAFFIGGGIVAVRVLSGPGWDGWSSSNGGVGRFSTSDGAVMISTSDGRARFPGPGDGSIPDDGLADAAQTRPAQYGDASYTWTAYPADSPEALALKFDPSANYAVGTTDGPDGTPFPALFAKTDGGWEAIAELDGDGAAIVGDKIYTIKYDDTNGDGPPTQTLRAFDVASDSWSDVALPEGTAPQGSQSLLASSNIEIGASNDVLVAKMGTYYDVDPNLLEGNETSYLTVDVGPEGNLRLVVTDFECMDRINSEMSAGSPEDESAIADLYEECNQEADPSEYGLTEADLALASTYTSTYWTLTDGTWQPVEFPDDGSIDATLHSNGIVETYTDSEAEGEGVPSASRFYAPDASGAFQPLFDGRTFTQLSALPGGQTGRPTRRVLAASNSFVLSQDPAAPDWSATDLNTLGDGPGWGRYDVYAQQVIDTADGGVAVLGAVYTDLPTEPTELTSGDYTIRFEPGDAGPTVTNNATGQPVVESMISTESGQVELLGFDDDGNQVTLASFGTSWTDVPALNASTKSAVLASPDGVTFGAVDAEDLIEMIDAGSDTDLVLSGLHDSNGKIVVNGALVNQNGEDVGGDYVFVGTPN